MGEFEEKRKSEIEECQNMGLPAFVKDCDPEVFVGANPASVGTLNLSERRTREERKNNVVLSKHEEHSRGVFLTGECAAAVSDIKPAAEIIDEMVTMAAEQIRSASS